MRHFRLEQVESDLTFFYFALFLTSGIVNFIFTMMILRELATGKAGMGFFDLRWHVLKNLNRYRDLTREKYGRAGAAYYGYLGTLALLVFSAALLLQSFGR